MAAPLKEGQDQDAAKSATSQAMPQESTGFANQIMGSNTAPGTVAAGSKPDTDKAGVTKKSGIEKVKSRSPSPTLISPYGKEVSSVSLKLTTRSANLSTARAAIKPTPSDVRRNDHTSPFEGSTSSMGGPGFSSFNPSPPKSKSGKKQATSNVDSDKSAVESSKTGTTHAVPKTDATGHVIPDESTAPDPSSKSPTSPTS